MKAIDHQGKFGEYVLDKNRLIDRDRLYNICKIEKSESTCRYIGLGPSGYFCAKNTPMKATLDNMANNNKMKSKGDNCEGIGSK